VAADAGHPDEQFHPDPGDLTPFAGLFDDGKPHTAAVRVLGTDHFLIAPFGAAADAPRCSKPCISKVVDCNRAAVAPP
jgi:hypothetical protein